MEVNFFKTWIEKPIEFLVMQINLDLYIDFQPSKDYQ